MLERRLEEDLVKYVDDLGGYAAKLKEDNKRGFLDRTLFLPEKKILFIELKRPKKSKKSFMQKVWVDRLTKMGFVAGFFDNMDDIKRAVEQC